MGSSRIRTVFATTMCEGQSMEGLLLMLVSEDELVNEDERNASRNGEIFLIAVEKPEVGQGRVDIVDEWYSRRSGRCVCGEGGLRSRRR